MALVLLVVIVLGSIVLLVVGFVAPRRSRKVQRLIDRTFFKGEGESGKAPGHLAPKALHDSLDSARQLLDKSAKAGRKGRRKTPL